CRRDRLAARKRRAMLATLTFAGLRISELLDLEWRDVDLAAGRLRVRSAKTDAGVLPGPAPRSPGRTWRAQGEPRRGRRVRVPLSGGHTTGPQPRTQPRPRTRDQGRERAARQGRPHGAAGGLDPPRAPAHVRVRARRARARSALRHGPDRTLEPDGHARHLRAGDARQ